MHFGVDTIWQNNVLVSHMMRVLIKGVTLVVETKKRKKLLSNKF